MKLQIIVAILLIGFSLQQCSIGCLKCNSLNQCQLCDITNNYFLSGSACALSTQTNCNLLSQNGNCVQCNTNFYLDVNSQKCLAVSTANIVSNCQNYNSGQICLACSGNFFVSAGRCSAVNITIANCQTYSANGQCTGCSSGFLIANDFASCVTLPTNTNCLFYTFLGCRACNSGFINNPNNYFTNFNSAAYIQNNFLQFFTTGFNSWMGLSVCQAVTVNNCLAYSSFNFCTQCSSSYFLQNGNCIAFPLPVIFGCLTYSTLVTCSVCQAGMYLSQNTCINNIAIANCLVYSGAASTTTCVQCNGGYYLQGNVCVNRTVSSSIQNCQTVSVTADVCAACVTGFILSTDNRICLVAIANCMSYSASTFQTTTLQCSLCHGGFYLSTSGTATVCVAGSIQFCQNYTINANSCTVCNNGYYLANNVCNVHVTIANCQTYDPTRANFCAVCTSGYYNFAYTTVCVQTTVKTGCSSYSIDGNSCSTCSAGYFLSSGNCNLIPGSFANCNTFSGTQCTLCNTGYMVNTPSPVGTCVLPLDYISSASNSPCHTMAPLATSITATWIGNSTPTQAPLTCATCNSYMYGYTPRGAEAICVSSAQLVLYSSFTAVAQCSRYGLNYLAAQVVVCMQCGSGYFLSGYQALAQTTSATSCISSCSAATTNSNAIIPDDFLGFVNICVPYVTPGAAVGALQLSGTCQRFGRITSQTIGTFTGAAGVIVGNDFKCFISAPSVSTALPTNFLAYPAPSATWYTYETYSTTTPLQISSDYYMGYSNTVDSASLFPTVLNYHGILPIITDSTAVITNAMLLGNNLSNCDIILNWGAASNVVGGFAFYTDSTAPRSIFANVAAATQYYSCFRCNFGYQLSYALAALPANNPPFPSCVQMTNCASSNTVYGGLPRFLNSIFSCHTCSQLSGSSTFPSIYIETGAATGTFLSYSILGVYNVAGTAISTANHGFRCAAAPVSIIIADSLVTGASVPNCAAYGYITVINTFAGVGATIAISTNGQQNTCIACAANYFPSYVAAAIVPATSAATSFLATTLLPAWIVISCTASANCDTSVITQFSSCGRCRTDLANAVVPSYFAFMDFTLTNCYQSYSQYCFILIPSPFSNTANNNVCDTCMAGYFLNADSVCEVYKVPNQSTSNGIFVNAWFSARLYTGTTLAVPATAVDLVFVRKHYLLSHRQLQYGVTGCSSGWIQAPANTWAPRVCVWSSFIYNNTGSYPATSVFINNCVKYNLTQVLSRNVCGGCNTGYIPTIDGVTCASNTGLPNCVFSQTGTNTGLCYQCSPNYYNVNGQCVSTSIPNCATYVNTIWSFTTPGTLQCATCLNGFFLSNDFLSCTAGNVINCISYAQGQSSQCNACAAGFVFLTLTSVYYCYPIPALLNCAFLQDTSATSGANFATISCALCNANSVQVFGARTWSTLGLTTQAQTTCMPFTLIANCIAYNQGSPIIKSNTFSCTQCSSGYWYAVGNSTCVIRVNMPSQCSNYSLTADLCTVCSSGSFLSLTGTNCVTFPNGIFQCNQYTSASTCIQCNSGWFLSNNACASSTLINNCAIYAANFTCSSCTSGFFLTNSTNCAVATATNCLTFTSITACATCANTFGLQTTNGVTSCVLVSLPNCLNSTTVAPFTCLICNTGYYPNPSGVCTNVAQTIANCIVYDSATTCVTCSSNSVLNVARTVCNATFYTSYIDPNCRQSFLTSTPTCTQCALGSFFSNGTCTTCSNNTLSSGCLSCDPLNNNNCLVCRPTYYMNSLAACIAINPTPTPNNNNTTPVNSAKMTKAVALSLALVTLYFDRF